ncbi:ribosome biogenesis protein RLP24-like [Gossypium australe]|uniref:Ribosome biogenesis protein RLP24-like n=1 Tax=Gossypium australe TaxID=47621 RepID=A0A5B6VS11_9ROSI|nr:ribosome biogenesis protein RLP24-like [Gossypium australe]
MAEEAGFTLGDKLSSLILSEMLLLVKDDLDDLRITVSAIIVMLPDAEERSTTSNFTAWLEKLKDALYDADDLLNELSFDVLRRLLFPWSRANNYVYLPKMSSQIQVIKNRLTFPERVFDMLNFFDHLLVKIPLMAAKSTTLVAGCPTRMKTTEKVKVTETDDLTREGVQSKFRDLENQLYDKGTDKVECKDFPGLEQALKNTAWGKIPEYLESIAIQIKKDRGKTTDVFHIAIQVLVCAAIKEMKDFSVEDLNWDTLKKWGATLNYAEKFGFQVGFADNLLNKNLLAYFAVQNLPKSTAKK